MKRRNYQEMLNLYEKWQSSGQSKKAFAKSHGLSPNIFFYWIKKFKEKQGLSSLPTPATGFQEISVKPAEANSGQQPSAKITLPCGTVIEFFTPVDAGLLKSLIR